MRLDNDQHSQQHEQRRARLYRVRAIVLRRLDLGEADRIVTLFTVEHGKVRVVAKGSRRATSRIAGHLEPFTAARLLIARTRGLDIVSQAETLNAFPALRTSETAIATAGYFAELVDTLLADEQPNESVYELLLGALGLLNSGRDPRLVTVILEMGVLRSIGYRPQLDACIACGAAIEAVAQGISMEGGVVCPNCLPGRPDAAAAGVGALRVLRAIDRGDIERLFGVRVPDDAWRDLDAVLGAYITRIAGRESQARRVLRELRLQ